MAPKLGIVAGGGDVPGRLIEICLADGRDFFVLAIQGFADEAVKDHEPDAWIRLGEAGKGLKLMRDAGVRELVIAGRVQRPSLAALRPDAWTAKLLMKSGKALLGDDSLLSLLVRAIEGEGFTVVPPEDIIGGLLASERQYGRIAPDAQALEDIAYAVRAAQAIGALDIGQAAVAQQNYVLGVEAAEGTDALIARCGELRLDGPGGVLVKLCKNGQDRRVDLPTIGAETVAAAAKAGLRGIAVEAGGALIVDAETTIRAADAAGIFVVGIKVTR